MEGEATGVGAAPGGRAPTMPQMKWILTAAPSSEGENSSVHVRKVSMLDFAGSIIEALSSRRKREPTTADASMMAAKRARSLRRLRSAKGTKVCGKKRSRKLRVSGGGDGWLVCGVGSAADGRPQVGGEARRGQQGARAALLGCKGGPPLHARGAAERTAGARPCCRARDRPTTTGAWTKAAAGLAWTECSGQQPSRASPHRSWRRHGRRRWRRRWRRRGRRRWWRRSPPACR